MNIAVVGAGYVGLTLSVCLVKMGHTVGCVEKDGARLAMIRGGRIPFHEPEIPEMLHDGIRSGRLRFSDDLAGAVDDAEIIFIAVGTPGNGDGTPDLSALDDAVAGLCRTQGSAIVAIKSTVPVGTTDGVAATLGAGFAVACNPEFLREGSAVHDFFHPHRIVIGTTSDRAAERMRMLYEPLDARVVLTTPRTAEMIKYSSNAFLAARVSFINEIASICEQIGVDVDVVAKGMGFDPRIGRHYLRAGIGFGGSCLPKDVRALAALARERGVEPTMLEAVMRVNESRRAAFVRMIEEAVGDLTDKTLAILGLSFKPGTSDVRESPALDIAGRLLARNARVRAYDPVAEPAAAAVLPDVTYCPSIEETLRGADAILILTDWPEFRDLDWEALARQPRRRLVFTASSAIRGHSIITHPATPALALPE